jgi:mannan endo-1,4-beta-mannosidase
VTESGDAWTPVGHNSSIAWPDLGGLFRRVNSGAVARHLDLLVEHGVTCLRLMLEYCHHDHRYFEQPAGRFKPLMVQYWDDLIAMCEKRGLRLLLTPFDTFWMWLRWDSHPYNARNGGPCEDRGRLLLCRRTRDAIKNRLAFATERWGGSGVVFAWDLWNEIHPSYAGNSAECFADFVDDVGGFLRAHEMRVHGRAHPQTVSVFSPHMTLDSRIAETVFRHPALDFANTHFYEEGTIDDPGDTVAPAVAAAKLTRRAIAEMPHLRPFFDSEHGPIHTYKDRHRTLPEAFDDEYFRHMQWAHFACGGAGGSMRWPNRKPHVLTRGMHRAQLALSKFLPLIGWTTFRRRPLCFHDRHIFGCGDDAQAVVWVLRADTIGPTGMLDPRAPEREVVVRLANLGPGAYRVTTWNTTEGEVAGEFRLAHDEPLRLKVRTDVAAAIRRT